MNALNKNFTAHQSSDMYRSNFHHDLRRLQLMYSRYSSMVSDFDKFEHILSKANKDKAQKYLNLDPKMKKMPWMKGQSNMKCAAVLIPLCHIDGKPSILFTSRSRHLNSHGGQVSFPGGKSDHADENLIVTALRETEEEIGLVREKVDIWGQLNPMPGRNFEIAVTGVIGYCGEIDLNQLEVNHNEVSTVFGRTIKSLCKPENFGYTKFRSARNYSIPVYLGGEQRIWGLTGFLLHITLNTIATEVYHSKI